MHPNETVINDYVDGALDAAARAEVERHLAECESCRFAVDDLRELARAAKALEPIEPPARAWRRVEKAIRGEMDARRAADAARAVRVRRSLAWLAAAATLVVATAVGLRLTVLAPRPAAPASAPAPSASGATAAAGTSEAALSVESELRQAEEHYDKAIKGLEQIADANQGALDPATAATLNKNLAVIDQAISESRAAVRAQPNSEPAQQSLLENFRTKIAVLQDTVALMNEMRKGNDTGAARIVSGLKQKGD